MSILQQIKDQVSADIEAVLEKSKKKPVTDDKRSHETKHLDKQMKMWKETVKKQQELEQYFYNEWQDAEKMLAKRKEQHEVAEQAHATELMERATVEMNGYGELAREYKESYDEQRERVNKLEEKGRALYFLKKKMERMKLTDFARAEESRAEENASKWTYYVEENGDLHEQEEKDEGDTESRPILDFDKEIEKLAEKHEKA